MGGEGGGGGRGKKRGVDKGKRMGRWGNESRTSAARAAASLASFSCPAAVVAAGDPNVRPCPCPLGICARGFCVGAEEEEAEPMTRPGVEKLSGLLDEREQRLPIFSFFNEWRGRWRWVVDGMGWDGFGIGSVDGFEGGWMRWR